jgi:NADPH:quinone reductase-like Zn-dependent oxidoreductase
MVRQGVIDNPPKTPFTMGFELAGEVEALGEHTSRFEVYIDHIDGWTPLVTNIMISK